MLHSKHPCSGPPSSPCTRGISTRLSHKTWKYSTKKYERTPLQLGLPIHFNIISIKKPFDQQHTHQMALGCDTPTLPANRNRLYEQEFHLSLPGCWDIHHFNPVPIIHQNEMSRWRWVPKLVMVSSLLWFLESHPLTSIPVLDGCQSINLQIFPDESSWQSRNDCATSPCQSCKWSRRPQVFYQIYIISCTFILFHFKPHVTHFCVRMPCHDFDS